MQEKNTAIEKWNKNVEKFLLGNSTFTAERQWDDDEDRLYHIEIDCYHPDGTPDGFVGWWDDEPGITSYGKTPWEVLCDL